MLKVRPSFSRRSTMEPDSGGCWSGDVDVGSFLESMKKTRPLGARAVRTSLQNDSNLASGTRESQKLKNTTSNCAGGTQSNRLAWTYRARPGPILFSFNASISDEASTTVNSSA